MVLAAGAFGGMWFVGASDVALVTSLLVVAGCAMGCGGVLSASILADVIDLDERRTGERKEGVYSAAMTLVLKVGTSLATAASGVVMTATASSRTSRSPRRVSSASGCSSPGCRSSASSSARSCSGASRSTTTTARRPRRRSQSHHLRDVRIAAGGEAAVHGDRLSRHERRVALARKHATARSPRADRSGAACARGGSRRGCRHRRRAEHALSIGVSMKPGQIALARMPLRP